MTTSPPSGSPPTRQVLAGILLIVAAGFLFTVMDATAKYLTRSLPLAEVAWGRYLFHASLALRLFERDIVNQGNTLFQLFQDRILDNLGVDELF